MGQKVGKYVVDAVIGKGAMGTVYRAHDHVLRRPVALKVLVPDDEAGAVKAAPTPAEARARFLREARAAAALQHPNVVAVYDVGEDAGLVYLAMELVEGTSLRRLIGDASVPIAHRVRWLVDVARALSAAHARGLVHRDVKPENVLVSKDGFAKLADFGIAKHRRDSAPSSFRTQTGQLVGTPDYMAPEQWATADVDGRADQYAWALSAWELLSAKPLPMGRPPDLGTVAPDLAPALVSVVTRAMAHRREERFASMDEIISALEPLAAAAATLPPAMAAAVTAAAADHLGHAPTVAAPPMAPGRTAPPPPAAPPKTKPKTKTATVFAVAVGATIALAAIGGLGAWGWSQRNVQNARDAETEAEAAQDAALVSVVPDADVPDVAVIDAAREDAAPAPEPLIPAPEDLQVSVVGLACTNTTTEALSWDELQRKLELRRGALATCWQKRFKDPPFSLVPLRTEVVVASDGKVTSIETETGHNDPALVKCLEFWVKRAPLPPPKACTDGATMKVRLRATCHCVEPQGKGCARAACP